ncbi:MAG: GNAT family N-acetyltransferase [Clostridia bacterium]|nr:GNAT family N-acetyltransferase [Clostridia bacterium]
MEVSIRKTHENEASELCKIQKSAFLPLYEKYHDDGNPCLRGVEDIANRLNSDYFRYFTIFLDGEIVGGVLYKCKGRTPFVDELEEGQYYLQRVYVKPEYQCKKIAQTAIILCEKELLNANCFFVDFPEDLVKNKRCYEKAGFVDTGKRIQVQSGLTLACFEKILFKN